jgi:WG containing repeat
MLPKKINTNGKYALIDAHGNALTPYYDFIFTFVDGFAVVANGHFYNGEKGVINTEGKVIIPVLYKIIYFLSEGHFLVYKNYNECAFFDTEGKETSPNIRVINAHNAITPLKEGLARMEASYGNFVFIDATGKQAINQVFTTVGMFCDGLARVQDNLGKWGFIDKTGAVVIARKYQYVQDFKEGIAAVAIPSGERDYIWGYINTKGEEIVAPQYLSASYFHEGRAVVTKDFGNYNYEYYLLDTTGNIVEKLSGYANMYGHNYHIKAGRNGKEGVISTQNEILLPFEYDSISHDFCGVRIVQKDGLSGVIDMNNKIVVPPMYDNIRIGSAYAVHNEDVRVFHYGDEFYFAKNNMHRTTIKVEKGGKFGGFPYFNNNEMYYTQDFIPVSYARESLVDKIGEFYMQNGCTFPVLDILQKLQSTDKNEASLGKDLLKTVNFLMETDQMQGIAIDTNIVLPIAKTWATSTLMNERIMSAHLIKALFLQIKKNGAPLIPLDYKTYRAFQAATAKKPFALEDVFEIIVPDFGFTNLFYPFITNNEPYKAFVDTDLSVKFLDDDSNILTKIPKGTDKTLEKMFKDVTKTYTILQATAVQQFSQHQTQCKTWQAADWKTLFLSNPFYFNLALSLRWQTQNGLLFTLQEDQTTVDANFSEVEIADNEVIALA